MKPGHHRLGVLLLVLCAFVPSVRSVPNASAVVTRRATLRSDPSTHHKPIAVLEGGDEVDLLEPNPSQNYYHVRTTDGIEGWVYKRSIELNSSSTSAPSALSTPTAPAVAPQPSITEAFSPNWDKPTPQPTIFSGPDGECGPTGDCGDTFTNLRKNRTDAAPTYHEVSWTALQSLPYPVAARSLADWTPQQMAKIQPYEGVPVSVVGYLSKIKVEDSGSGESTNCHFVNPEEVDWHMPLVQHPGDGEDTAVVVETTPRMRQLHPKWTTNNLASWVDSQAPVRISGWTLLDPEHRAHLGRYRSTLWEIHPIIKIEVFKNGQWIDSDDL